MSDIKEGELMIVLGVIYLLSVIMLTFCGKLEVNNEVDNSLYHRFMISLVASIIVTLVFGLPLLGILYLLGL